MDIFTYLTHIKDKSDCPSIGQNIRTNHTEAKIMVGEGSNFAAIAVDLKRHNAANYLARITKDHFLTDKT